MGASVLLIDQDRSAIEELHMILAGEGYHVDHAMPGALAIRQILAESPDLVILGVNDPYDGWGFCQRLLTFLDQPLLLLVASAEPRDRGRGLDMGADDCLGKPIDAVELLARLRALLRREPRADSRLRRSYFVDDDLVVDLTRRQVEVRGEPVALTHIEFQLLSCLVTHLDEVLPQQWLLDQVWGPGGGRSSDLLKPHICSLRRKLESDPHRPRRIVTQRGEGYVLRRILTPRASGGNLVGSAAFVRREA